MGRTDLLSLVKIPWVVLIAMGLAFAGSHGGYSSAGVPVFALCIAVAFTIQWIAFVPAFIKRTEKLYDLTGCLTFLTVMAIALILSAKVSTRSMLLVGIITIWSLRLGSFLFTRIRVDGEDRRFRETKKSFAGFLLAWTLQGLWVSFSVAAALAAITSKVRIDLDVFALIGFLLWLLGFGLEVVADRQKSKFRSMPENKDKFINTGLWAWSRHPNYFGEIVLWVGIALIAFPVLRGWQFVMLTSPIFIAILLTKISGIPLLESRANEQWGGQSDYEAYKSVTSILIPMPPSKENPK